MATVAVKVLSTDYRSRDSETDAVSVTVVSGSLDGSGKFVLDQSAPCGTIGFDLPTAGWSDSDADAKIKEATEFVGAAGRRRRTGGNAPTTPIFGANAVIVRR